MDCNWVEFAWLWSSNGATLSTFLKKAIFLMMASLTGFPGAGVVAGLNCVVCWGDSHGSC